jgi:hypothetical protein
VVNQKVNPMRKPFVQRSRSVSALLLVVPIAITVWASARVHGGAADGPNSAETESVAGDSEIRRRVGPSELVITTTSRVAGAIHSLTWNGQEFLDSFDHGRQLQSAANFDLSQPFVPEVFNPTEAGSLSDGVGPKSSSRLLRLHADGHRLETTNQMAFWLRPGETSQGHPALNTMVLSDHLVSKRVEIGMPGLPHAIQYDVTFTVPENERHTLAQFEAVTGYMPDVFSEFWAFAPDPGSGVRRLVSVDDGPGEQAHPVVLSTSDLQFAMGVYSPDQPSPGFAQAGYGRFRFRNERVTKWNCVFRVRDPSGVRAGDYRFRCRVVVGRLTDVEHTLSELMSRPETP